MLLPNISIIVIGFNEEENLDRTFRAIGDINYPRNKYEIIYVDSGSVDDSRKIARKYTNKIFLEERFPSPSRNRNRGLLEAQFDIVHFVDGDVIIDRDYLINIHGLFSEKNVQAIVGQLDEQNPTFFNRLAALVNIEKKEGFTPFTSTGATYLRRALLAVDGYDERLSRGEEAELGERFRIAGYKIWCSKHLMGRHNYAILNLWQYVQKYKKNAQSQVQIALLSGSTRFFQTARNRFINQLLKLGFTLSVLLYCYWGDELWPIFAVLFLFCLNRNKSMIKRYLRINPFLMCCDLIINFFFYWMWWYGFFKELICFFFDNRTRQFYNLEKSKLS